VNRFLFGRFQFGGFRHLKEEDNDGHKGSGA
jgi:hypothetical protein